VLHRPFEPARKIGNLGTGTHMDDSKLVGNCSNLHLRITATLMVRWRYISGPRFKAEWYRWAVMDFHCDRDLSVMYRRLQLVA